MLHGCMHRMYSSVTSCAKIFLSTFWIQCDIQECFFLRILIKSLKRNVFFILNGEEAFNDILCVKMY